MIDSSKASLIVANSELLSNLPTVKLSKKNLSKVESMSARFRISTQTSPLKLSQVVSLTNKKDISTDLNEKFFDFGFETRKRKLSERIGDSKKKITYPGHSDISKKILDALQKGQKTPKIDDGNQILESNSICIKE